MVEEIAFENDRIFNYKGLMTLTLERVILHTVVHHSSTSTYMPISLKPKKRFVDGRMYVHTYVQPSSCKFIFLVNISLHTNTRDSWHNGPYKRFILIIII